MQAMSEDLPSMTVQPSSMHAGCDARNGRGQHLSTLRGLPLASAMPMSFFMTPACLQGWMEAEGTPLFGKGSTVIVLRACSSLTSSSICPCT